jgi:hypothetical protein
LISATAAQHTAAIARPEVKATRHDPHARAWCAVDCPSG